MLAPDLKYSGMFIQLLALPTLLVLVLFVLLSGALDASFVPESNFLPTCCWSSTSHITWNNLNSLILGNPTSSRPSSDTTKNLHVMTLSLCFNRTEKAGHLQYQPAILLPLIFLLVWHYGWLGSCFCISEVHHDHYSCLHSHLVNYFFYAFGIFHFSLYAINLLCNGFCLLLSA